MNLSPMLTPDAAYERCMAITQREAKNFYYGIRLLRPPKRRAMAALYAFARYIDDIGDGNDPPEVKLFAADRPARNHAGDSRDAGYSRDGRRDRTQPPPGAR